YYESRPVILWPRPFRELEPAPALTSKVEEFDLPSIIMPEKIRRVRLLYIVLGVLLLVGLLPLALTGTLLSSRSADELRAVEGRYQAQLVQDKTRQIELYGQRYRDVVSGLAQAFEIAGG